jgi:hypothetical protein
MPTWKRGKKESGPKAKARRIKALKSLQKDLKSNMRREDGVAVEELSDVQKKRIVKEIDILKSKVA